MHTNLHKLAWGIIPLLLFQPLSIPQAYAQAGQTQNQGQFTVTGRVATKSGEGLPGVTVVVKGTTIGATSDTNGRYSINLPDSKGVLVYSFIGFAPNEVPVNGQTTLNVALSDDVKALEEVVVI